MKLNKLYLESINYLDEDIQEMLIKEAPHTQFGIVPDELKILKAGLVDLNFESYDLPREQRNKIGRAFCKDGVAIPGTRWRLRSEYGGTAVIEPTTGNEIMLPATWKRYIISVNDGVPIWLGKSIRQDQMRDTSGMVETEDGWICQK